MVAKEFLQTHALFGGVSDDEIAMVVPMLREGQFPAGAFVVRQGEKADRLFFIQEGSVDVLEEVSGPGGVVVKELAVLGPGDTFGEMALIDIQPRSASVRARTDLSVLSMSNMDMHTLYKESPHAFVIIVMNIAREISRRLRKMNKLLASSVYSSDKPGTPGP